jgi:hypothetical protein
MTDVAALLAHQARWQKSRASLPWPEKVRIAERMRDDIAAMRRTRPKAARPVEPRPPR